MSRTWWMWLLFVPMNALAQIPAVVDGNGQLIGSYLGGIRVDPQVEPRPQAGAFGVVSRTGYTFAVEPRSARLGWAQDGLYLSPDGQYVSAVVYFTDAQCAGPAYVEVGVLAPESVRSRAVGGFVFASGAQPGRNPYVYYAPKGGEAVSAAGLGLTRASSCRNDDGAFCSCGGASVSPERYFIEALPNDTAVTGVSNTPWVGPATVEMVPFAAFIDLFCDGFEAHLICAGR